MTTQQAAESGQIVTHSLCGEGFDASEDGTGRGTPIIPFDTTQITSPDNYSSPQPGDACHPLAEGQHPPAVAYRTTGNDGVYEQGDKTAALNCNTDPNQQIVAYQYDGMAVRRLTPRECERLQGFPDDYTLIPYGNRGQYQPRAQSGLLVRCPDGPRYRALGNSMAVPVMRWIGERILEAEGRAVAKAIREAVYGDDGGPT